MKAHMISRFTHRNVIVLVTISILLLCIAGKTATMANAATQHVTAKTNEGNIKATRYSMLLKLDTKKDRLYESVTMTIRNDTKKSIKTVVLRDMSNAMVKYAVQNNESEGNKGKKAAIRSIALVGSKKAIRTKYSKNRSVIAVKLTSGKSLKPGKSIKIRVKTYTDVPNRQDRFSVTKTRRGKLYLLSFCFPYLADNVNGKWIKDPFFDDGESRSYALANYNVKFKAPKSYKVAATGTNKTKQGVTRIKASNVRDFAIACCNFMKKDTYRVKGIKVNSYYLTGKNRNKYRKIVNMTAKESIAMFTSEVGSLPKSIGEIDIVHSLFGYAFGGMEFPGLIMVNGSSYYDGGSTAYAASSLVEKVSHELGHQWFYATVGNREYKAGWIDEGFTTYLEWLFSHTQGKAVNHALKADKYKNSLEELMRETGDYYRTFFDELGKGYYINTPPSKYKNDQSYGHMEYDGAMGFLIEIRDILGADKFSELLKEYYGAYATRVVRTRDVIRLIRSYATGDNAAKLEKVINKCIDKKYL